MFVAKEAAQIQMSEISHVLHQYTGRGDAQRLKVLLCFDGIKQRIIFTYLGNFPKIHQPAVWPLVEHTSGKKLSQLCGKDSLQM